MQSICPGSFHVVGSGCSVHGNSWAWEECGRRQSRILGSSWSAGARSKCDSVCSSDSSLRSLLSHFLLPSQNCCTGVLYLVFDFVFSHHCRSCVWGLGVRMPHSWAWDEQIYGLWVISKNEFETINCTVSLSGTCVTWRLWANCSHTWLTSPGYLCRGPEYSGSTLCCRSGECSWGCINFPETTSQKCTWALLGSLFPFKNLMAGFFDSFLCAWSLEIKGSPRLSSELSIPK